MAGIAASQAALNIVPKDPAFYNNTIRNLAMPWTNRDQTVFAPLNDYVATVVGMVRDDVPFNTLLSADIVYIADAAAGVPSYSPSNNAMYDAMDAQGVDLKAHLTSSTQSALTGVPATATAGVLTTRAAAAAFFINGTNRAMFRFTMMKDRKSTRLNSSHQIISYAVFCLKKKKTFYELDAVIVLLARSRVA